jgi:hypothetical protein
MAFEDTRQFFRDHKRWDRFPGAYQGFVKALRDRHRPLADAIWEQFRSVAPELAGKQWRLGDWVALAVDGSRFECPRSVENEAVLGCAGKSGTAPQIQVTQLWHMGSGLPWAAACEPGPNNEQVAFRGLLSVLPERSLIVADAGFFSYETARSLIDEGHSFVIRVGGNKTLLTDLFGADSYAFGPDQQVFAWPAAARQQAYPPLSLRLIEIETANADEPNVFLLTPLPVDELSDAKAGELYAARWGAAEIGYRTHKQTLESAKLRSRAPDLALYEVEWAILSIFLLGALALASRPMRETVRNDWSPAATLKVVRHRMKHGLRRGGQWSRRIATDLCDCRIDRRPRHGPKSTRRHPQKKKEQPPQPPKVRAATKSERQAAENFTAI